MRLWYYRTRGDFYAMGPVEANSEAEARKKIRKAGFRPTEIWETSREEMEQIQRMNREDLAGLSGIERLMAADI